MTARNSLHARTRFDWVTVSTIVKYWPIALVARRPLISFPTSPKMLLLCVELPLRFLVGSTYHGLVELATHGNQYKKANNACLQREVSN